MKSERRQIKDLEDSIHENPGDITAMIELGNEYLSIEI